MKILFIQTGGSIDKDYPKEKRYSFDISEPAAKRILSRVDINFEFEIKSVLKKDSLDMTEADREKIYNACVKAKEDKIIITHGTDTIIQTAKKLKSIKNKVIVLTGAVKPEVFSGSDADFNLGMAVGAVNVLKKGIYIAISGRVYSPDKIKHISSKGEFAEIR